MIVHLLIAICVKQPVAPFSQNIIDLKTIVFKDADRCLRNAEHNKKLLQGKYDQVNITCTEKKLE